MASQDLGMAVSTVAAQASGAKVGGGACRTCRFFGGYSRSGGQAWCLRELPMKVLWMSPGKGCEGHVDRGHLAVASAQADAADGRLAA
jgi:hypothetical protein